LVNSTDPTKHNIMQEFSVNKWTWTFSMTRVLAYHFELKYPEDVEAISWDLSQTCN
jgi:hypothetical protein